MRFDQHVPLSGMGDVLSVTHFANIAPQKCARQGGFADIGVGDQTEGDGLDGAVGYWFGLQSRG